MGQKVVEERGRSNSNKLADNYDERVQIKSVTASLSYECIKLRNNTSTINSGDQILHTVKKNRNDKLARAEHKQSSKTDCYQGNVGSEAHPVDVASGGAVVQRVEDDGELLEERDAVLGAKIEEGINVGVVSF